MSDSTWLLLQLCVAGWTGLLMWGVVRLVVKIWNGLVHVRRVHVDRSRASSDGMTTFPSRLGPPPPLHWPRQLGENE